MADGELSYWSHSTKYYLPLVIKKKKNTISQCFSLGNRIAVLDNKSKQMILVGVSALCWVIWSVVMILSLANKSVSHLCRHFLRGHIGCASGSHLQHNETSKKLFKKARSILEIALKHVNAVYLSRGRIFIHYLKKMWGSHHMYGCWHVS